MLFWDLFEHHIFCLDFLGKELEKISEKYNFYGTDISEKAIEIAQKNANSNNVNVKFYLGDLFESINVNEKFDLIVSNPPYIRTEEISSLEDEVKLHDRHSPFAECINAFFSLALIISHSQKK